MTGWPAGAAQRCRPVSLPADPAASDVLRRLRTPKWLGQALAGSARLPPWAGNGEDGGEDPSLRVIDGRRGPLDARMASRRIRQRPDATPSWYASRFVRALVLPGPAGFAVSTHAMMDFAAAVRASVLLDSESESCPQARVPAFAPAADAHKLLGRASPHREAWPSGFSTRFRTRPVRSNAAHYLAPLGSVPLTPLPSPRRRPDRRERRRQGRRSADVVWDSAAEEVCCRWR